MQYSPAYFEKYYTRFYPSRARLHTKIDQKVTDLQTRQEIKDALEPIIVEDLVLEHAVQGLIFRGKSTTYMTAHLIRKGFDRDHVLQKLSEESEMARREVPTVLTQKIRVWQMRGKSRAQVRQELWAYKDRIDDIEEFLDTQYSPETEQEIMKRERDTLFSRSKTDQQARDNLARRGFRP